VISRACLVSQHATGKMRENLLKPVVFPLPAHRYPGRPGHITARLPGFGVFFLFAKEDPDIDASPGNSGEQARFLWKRPPMRHGQIPLCQPVVTDHNSFSGSPALSAGVTNREISCGRIVPVSFPVRSRPLHPPWL